MNGKNNYDSKSLIKKINRYINIYKNKESIVLYGYDTDDIDTNYDHKKYDQKISEFCTKNGYKLVYFCRDIEEVFLNKRVDNKNDKKKLAENFSRSNNIVNIDLSKFKSNKKIKGVVSSKRSFNSHSVCYGY